MRFLGRIVLALLIGLAELGLIVLLDGSSVNSLADPSARDMLMMWIVCTAGVALIVWIPIALIMGFITLQVIRFPFVLAADRRRATHQSTPPTGRKHAGGPDVSTSRSVSRYILKLRAEGVSESVIRGRLQRAGWTAKDIGLTSAGT